MKRRRQILVVVGILVAVVVALLVWPGEREPEYQGKRLSEWLEECRGLGAEAYLPPNLEARDAVLNIGTNALPSLLKWLAYRKPAWKTKAYSAYSKAPQLLKVKFLERYLNPKPEILAVRGFYILGTIASPAIPQLKAMCEDPNEWPSPGFRVERCLALAQGREMRDSLPPNPLPPVPR